MHHSTYANFPLGNLNVYICSWVFMVWDQFTILDYNFDANNIHYSLSFDQLQFMVWRTTWRNISPAMIHYQVAPNSIFKHNILFSEKVCCSHGTATAATFQPAGTRECFSSRQSHVSSLLRESTVSCPHKEGHSRLCKASCHSA